MFSLVAGQSRFIVNVGAKNGERCSAIILSDRHVLTTAECIDRTSLAVNETVLLVEIHVTAQGEFTCCAIMNQSAQVSDLFQF